MKTHICTCCRKQKELTSENFYRNKLSPTGFKRECKECISKKPYKKKANIKRRIYKYKEEDMTGSMVEDSQYKKIEIQCMEKCGNTMKILWDTESKMRLPRKRCARCEAKIESDYDLGIADDVVPSELPLMATPASFMAFGKVE